MVPKGFFANINMKPENKVTGSQGVVKLFMEYLSTDIHNFQIFFELHVDVSEKSFQDHS